MSEMKWDNLLVKNRFCSETPEFDELGRTGFARDLDRIVFSTAFRRLQGKTQVHPLPKNDHVHNRLTHTLEVASVGRTLGTRTGVFLRDAGLLPESHTINDIGAITQAACTAHDIGNPPFGHAFESSISDWFTHNLIDNMWTDYLKDEEIYDLQRFDGNAQGFRILTQLEHHFFNGGMRLSYPMLATFLKYPWTPKSAPSGKPSKASAFLSEEKHLRTVCEAVGLLEVSPSRWCRHPLAHLVEAADDICYRIIDIEDGIELGILNFSDYRRLLNHLSTKIEISDDLSPGAARRQFFALRGRVFDALIESTVRSFQENYDGIMNGTFTGDLIAHSKTETSQLLEESSNICRDRIFVDRKKTIIEIGVYENVNMTMGMFCEAVRDYIALKDRPDRIPGLSRKIVQHVESEGYSMPETLYECLRGVVDYISGMTDNYAGYVARQVSGMAY